jgi:hypothetical protein
MDNQQSKPNQRRAARFMTHEALLSQGYVRTPGGFRKQGFVHRIKPGDGVDKSGNKLALFGADLDAARSEIAPQNPQQDLSGMGGGWTTWATWVNGTANAITSFTTTWEVPSAPTTDSNQLIYLFNALEDQAGNVILQPVLQWGVSGAGGGSYWSVASWYVDSSGHAFCTPVVQVSAGDQLIGLMTSDGTNYSSEFQGIADTKLIARGLGQLAMATQTLEAYGLTKLSDYPNSPSTRMAAIDIQLGGNVAVLNWSQSSMVNPAFGEHTQIVSNANPGGEVDLFY